MEKKKLLLFDDDKQLLEMITMILESFGYLVAVSSTSHDVIEKVNEIQPDLILMDNWIPSIGGIEATQLLKNHQEFNRIPVIYLSANKDIQSLAKQAGADDYLEKPFDIIDLENIISKRLY
ncbi:PleD family two-component system response regulator [Sphingobacterium sp. HMA12]|uniref:response regulator n=1 Tax=Sphingobacterium sp. HMA12 TaxID=2050894 RepID=UPI000CEA10AB|nr:response regulator [Sphingobacterium sp. HMA12]